jgi:hypothetical protein
MSEKTYRANEVVSCVDEGEDGAMLYNPDKDDTVLLNPSGRIVWALLSSPRTLDEIAVHLATASVGFPSRSISRLPDAAISSAAIASTRTR